jgi:hypothetical protein
MLFERYLATKLVALNLKLLGTVNHLAYKGVKNTMEMTELIVIGFLAMLGLLAFNNSRKVSKEIKKMAARK